MRYSPIIRETRIGKREKGQEEDGEDKEGFRSFLPHLANVGLRANTHPLPGPVSSAVKGVESSGHDVLHRLGLSSNLYSVEDKRNGYHSLKRGNVLDGKILDDQGTGGIFFWNLTNTYLFCLINTIFLKPGKTNPSNLIA